MQERNTVEVNLSGGIIFFTLGEDSDHPTIKAGFSAIGIGNAVPETNTTRAALKNALVRTFGNRRTKIDALDGRPGYTVTRVKGEVENSLRTLDYDVEFTAEVPVATLALPFFNPATGQQVEPSGATECRDRFIAGLNSVSSHKLSRALVNLIEGKLNGISLRPTGGIYWLPEDSMRIWGQVAQVVETSSPSNQVYKLRTSVDEDSIKAICAALTAKVETEVTEITDEVLNSEFQQERAFNSRAARAEAMMVKVQEYASILGTSLSTLSDQCKEASKVAVAAKLEQLGM